MDLKVEEAKESPPAAPGVEDEAAQQLTLRERIHTFVDGTILKYLGIISWLILATGTTDTYRWKGMVIGLGIWAPIAVILAVTGEVDDCLAWASNGPAGTKDKVGCVLGCTRLAAGAVTSGVLGGYTEISRCMRFVHAIWAWYANSPYAIKF